MNVISIQGQCALSNFIFIQDERVAKCDVKKVSSLKSGIIYRFEIINWKGHIGALWHHEVEHGLKAMMIGAERP